MSGEAALDWMFPLRSQERMTSPVLGVVLEVRYADDPRNQSRAAGQTTVGSSIECRVLVVDDGTGGDVWQIDSAAVIPQGASGLANYAENPIRACSRAFTGSFSSGWLGAQLAGMDGDFCVVDFLGGARDKAVIRSWFRHPFNTRDVATAGFGGAASPAGAIAAHAAALAQSESASAADAAAQAQEAAEAAAIAAAAPVAQAAATAAAVAATAVSTVNAAKEAARVASVAAAEAVAALESASPAQALATAAAKAKAALLSQARQAVLDAKRTAADLIARAQAAEAFALQAAAIQAAEAIELAAREADPQAILAGSQVGGNAFGVGGDGVVGTTVASASASEPCLDQRGRFFLRPNGLAIVVSRDGDVWIDANTCGADLDEMGALSVARKAIGGDITVNLKRGHKTEWNFNAPPTQDRSNPWRPQPNPPRVSDGVRADLKTRVSWTEDEVTELAGKVLKLMARGGADSVWLGGTPEVPPTLHAALGEPLKEAFDTNALALFGLVDAVNEVRAIVGLPPYDADTSLLPPTAISTVVKVM